MRPFDARLLQLVPRARPALLVLAVLGGTGGLAAIAQAFGVAYLVLAVVHSDAPLPLPSAAALALGAFAARGIAAGLTEVMAARAGALVSCALRDQLLAAWLARPAEQRPDAATALTNATQGATAVEPYVARYLPALINAAVLPAAAVLAMLTQDWRTAIIPVLTLPLLPLFAALIGATTADATDARMRTLATLSGHFLDVMRGLPALVSYGRAHRQARVIRAVSHDHRRATVATLRLAFMSSAALELLATISVAIVAVWTGISLASGTMELRIALPLILLAPEAYWPIRRVGAEFHNAADGANALAAIAGEVLPGRGGTTPARDDTSEPAGETRPDTSARIPGATADRPEATTLTSTDGTGVTSDPAAIGIPPGSGIPGHPGGRRASAPAGGRGSAATAAARTAEAAAQVVLTGASYRYAPGLPLVIDGLDARFGRGLTVLTGPSGAGKTTVLELIAGLRLPSSGTVAAPEAHLVTQRPFLSAGTLRDNLRLGAPDGISDADLLGALSQTGLGEFTRALPAGLDTMLGDDGFGLSAGQRSRVALARALLSARPVLLLDEPTAHLDAGAERAVHQVITGLARDRVVIAVTHREALMALADHRLDLACAREVAR